MTILNKWECSEFELVLYKTNRAMPYRIDINNTKEKETSYCYEFKKQKEAEEFFNTMWKHIFII